MPNSDDVGTRLDRLLRESAALRERSDALAKEAERLRVQIEKEQAPPDQRKKPRVKAND
jgi:hypothetical protein